MTAREMMPAIGQEVYLRVEGSPNPMYVLCRVEDVKNAYGRVRVNVSPLRGKGLQWVELSRITAVETPSTSGQLQEAR